jgi:hypothetical protein
VVNHIDENPLNNNVNNLEWVSQKENINKCSKITSHPRRVIQLDLNENILEWSSEEIALPYKSPLDNRIHKYYPDFYVKERLSDGTIKKYIVEIKPKKQTLEPKVQSNITKRYIQEVHTYGINKSKWTQAQEYCKDRGWKFMIFTEHELGIKF